jgi:hypothetical protein
MTKLDFKSFLANRGIVYLDSGWCLGYTTPGLYVWMDAAAVDGPFKRIKDALEVVDWLTNHYNLL